MATILESVKKADRISGTYLDDDINRLDVWVRAEMVRLGIPQTVAASTSDALIVECVIAGILAKMATDDKRRAEALESYTFQIDNLRRHIWIVNDGEGGGT